MLQEVADTGTARGVAVQLQSPSQLTGIKFCGKNENAVSIVWFDCWTNVCEHLVSVFNSNR